MEAMIVPSFARAPSHATEPKNQTTEIHCWGRSMLSDRVRTDTVKWNSRTFKEFSSTTVYGFQGLERYHLSNNIFIIFQIL